MRPYLIPFVLFLGCFSCASSNYLVVDDQSYNSALSKPNRKKLIYLKTDSRSNSDVNFVRLLNKKKWEELGREISAINDNNTRLFISSIRYMLSNDYNKSFSLLEQLKPADFDCQVLMLKTDCRYEMKEDVKELREQYQQTYDCSTNWNIKAITKDRFRFLNYGY